MIIQTAARQRVEETVRGIRKLVAKACNYLQNSRLMNRGSTSSLLPFEKLKMSLSYREANSLEGASYGSELSSRTSGLSPTGSSGTFLASLSLQGEVSPQGYDVEFDPPLELKYECPICLLGLRAAVQTPCGHRFCRGCIEKSIRDSGPRCPVDNEELQEDQLFPDNFAKREILSLTVICPHAGCNQRMELRKLDHHRVLCQFAMAPCPLCQDSVTKNQLEEHAAQHCLRRPVSCPSCAQVFVYGERKVHELLCPLASVVCEYCSVELIRDQLASHYDTDCLKAPAACPFSSFGCQEKAREISGTMLPMQRNALAQHMQEFTQIHMRHMADYVRSQSQGSSLPASRIAADGRGVARAGVPCECSQQWQDLNETVRELEARLVLQDHQLRELSINNNTQAAQVAELRRQLRSLEETVHEMEAQQCQGVFVWRVEGFTALLRSQEAGQPVVIYSPAFYTGRPGYKLCLRLHLQTPSANSWANYISLFLHTMQGEFDSQLFWPLRGTVRLAILDQVESHHHEVVMEAKPDLHAFQRPTLPRNPKGFGYLTFLHLQALMEHRYVQDDTLLVRCEVTPYNDPSLHLDTFQSRGLESSL
ncbi:TNF receptor-associated factor 6-like isoform X1 [Arapaima gigas]